MFDIRYDITKPVIKCLSCAIFMAYCICPPLPSLVGKLEGEHTLLLLGWRRGLDMLYGIIIFIIFYIISAYDIGYDIICPWYHVILISYFQNCAIIVSITWCYINLYMNLHVILAMISYAYDILKYWYHSFRTVIS